jgi:hypothetical protein
MYYGHAGWSLSIGIGDDRVGGTHTGHEEVEMEEINCPRSVGRGTIPYALYVVFT